MTTRVLSSDQAATTIQQMQSLLNSDLTSTLKTLISQGNILSDPSVWDGQHAANFRGHWPTTSQQLNTTLANLQELQRTLQNIHTNIFTAGGNA